MGCDAAVLYELSCDSIYFRWILKLKLNKGKRTEEPLRPHKLVWPELSLALFCFFS